MTDKTISALPAITSLAASDLFVVDQDAGSGNYTTSKVTAANALGGALAPASLAINGATLGSDKLAVTGSATISGAVQTGTQFIFPDSNGIYALKVAGKNSGLFWTSSTNILGAIIGTSTMLAIDATGVSVGLSTAPARAGLQVHNPVNASTFVQLTNPATGSTNTDGLLLGMTAGGDATFFNQENGILSIGTNGAYQLVLSSASVAVSTGIAINGASIGSAKLAVSGAVGFSGGNFAWSNNGNAAADFALSNMTNGTAAEVYMNLNASGQTAQIRATSTGFSGGGLLAAGQLYLYGGSGGGGLQLDTGVGTTKIGAVGVQGIVVTAGAVTMPVSLAINGATIGSNKLAVTGAAAISADSTISGLTIGKGGGAIASNTALGYQALNSNTDATNPVENTIVGYQAGYSINGYPGYRNTFLGYRSGYYTTTGYESVAIGNLAGPQSGSYATIYNFTAIGYHAYTNASGATAIGANALAVNASSTAIGAGASASTDYGVAIGSGATISGGGLIAIGEGASATASYAHAIGKGATCNVGARMVIGSATYLNSLVVPSGIDVAFGGSLAVNGATIGSDKLAVTGSATVSSTVVGNSFVAMGTTGLTNGLGLATTNTPTFYSNSSERARITSAGLFLIGYTSSAASNYKLQVNGDTLIGGGTLNPLDLAGAGGTSIIQRFLPSGVSGPQLGCYFGGSDSSGNTRLRYFGQNSSSGATNASRTGDLVIVSGCSGDGTGGTVDVVFSQSAGQLQFPSGWGIAANSVVAVGASDTLTIGASFRTKIRTNNTNIDIFDGGVNQPTYIRGYTTYGVSIGADGALTSMGSGGLSINGASIGSNQLAVNGSVITGALSATSGLFSSTLKRTSGVTTVPNATATTIISSGDLPTGLTLLFIGSQGSSHSAGAIIAKSGVAVVLQQSNNGSFNITVSIDGSGNIQLTQSSGLSRDLDWALSPALSHT